MKQSNGLQACAWLYKKWSFPLRISSIKVRITSLIKVSKFAGKFFMENFIFCAVLIQNSVFKGVLDKIFNNGVLRMTLIFLKLICQFKYMIFLKRSFVTDFPYRNIHKEIFLNLWEILLHLMTFAQLMIIRVTWFYWFALISALGGAAIHICWSTFNHNISAMPPDSKICWSHQYILDEYQINGPESSTIKIPSKLVEHSSCLHEVWYLPIIIWS